jgi:hypothetical protein
MKHRCCREPEFVAYKPRAVVEFMGVAIAVCEDEGRLYLVRAFPDGSAEKLAELDTPGTTPEHYLSLMHHGVRAAYELLKEEEGHLDRSLHGPRGPMEHLFDDLGRPFRGSSPERN